MYNQYKEGDRDEVRIHNRFDRMAHRHEHEERQTCSARHTDPLSMLEREGLKDKNDFQVQQSGSV